MHTHRKPGRWLTCMSVCAVFGRAVAGPVDFSTWQSSMAIQFAGYARSETLTNFPVLVQFAEGSNGFHYADFAQPATGTDLRFTDATKTNELNYEVDNWNTGGVSYVWVQVPALSNANASIWAYWGKSGVSAPDCTTNGAVWTNGYHGVWHMNQTNAADSTANRLNGTSLGNTNATGFIGPAQGFNGSSFLRILDAFNPTAYTLSAWVRPSTTSSGTIVRRTDNGEAGTYSHQLRLANTAVHYLHDGAQKSVTGTTTLNVGNWYHIVGVAKNNSTMRLYVNGKEEGTAITIGTLWSSGDRWNVGKANPDYLNGAVDELQYSTVVRSSNWIWAAYQNQASNRVFNSYSNVTASAFPKINNANGASSVLSTTATLNGTLTSTGGAPTLVWVFWDTNNWGMNKVWAFTNDIGGAYQDTNSLAYSATNLTPGTTYFYTYYASNSLGYDSWALQGAKSFQTLNSPVVDNGGGATNIGPHGTATLRGTLTAGGSAHVYLYYGTSSSSWAFTNDFSTISQGAFATNVTGLLAGTTYYYQTYATNVSGSFTAPVTNFSTPSYTWITSSTNLALSQTNLYTGVPLAVSGAGVVLTLAAHTNHGSLATYAFGTLLVIDGATVLCKGQTSGPSYDDNAKGVAIQVAGDVLVDSISSISAVGQGFYNTGPGYGDTGAEASGGAGHGGRGGDARYAVTLGPSMGGAAYGSALQPTTLGSGGEQSYGSGAIKIVAGGTVTVDGIVDAKGATNSVQNTHNSAGAGGSIWIQAGTLSGAGLIRADGGDSVTNGIRSHGGGGGGRIALYLNADSFGGVVSAYGGTPFVEANRLVEGYGAAGTIYKKLASQPNGTLIVDNNGKKFTGWGANATYLGWTNDTTAYTFDSIVLTNAGCLSVNGLETLNLTQDTIRSDGSGKLCWTMGLGTLALPSSYVVSNMTLVLNNGTPAGLTNLTVLTNSCLSHFPNTTGDVYRMDLTLDALTVQAGGAILVSSNGILHDLGPGVGQRVYYSFASGSGHGGRGGFSGEGFGLLAGGTTYGSAMQPVRCGSGGVGMSGVGDNTRTEWESQGGGAAKLTVSGTLRVDGAILAEGSSARYIYCSGGSGGSIWITAHDLAGSGVISARGGSYLNGSNVGGSGGGRIALYLTNNAFAGTVRADGGASGAAVADRGGAGTIFVKGPSQTYGELRVDGSNVATFAASALISTTNDTGTYTFDQLTLLAKGRLEIPAGQTLQILGSPYPNLAGDTNSSGILVNRGTVLLPASCTLSNITLANDNLASLGALQNLTLTNTAKLTHSRNWATDDYRLSLTLQNLTIATGATVTADACGYTIGYGPGAPALINYITPVTNATYAGVGSGNTNAPYGNPYAPTNLGSGGTGYYQLGMGTEWSGGPTLPYGGGAIRLKVPGTLTVNGTISANANACRYYAGGGSGGSIWLDAGTLAGSGTVRANGVAGGAEYNPTTGSGGGRIAIYYGTGSFTGVPAAGLYNNADTNISTRITVQGGYNVGVSGPEDGTLYVFRRSGGTAVLFW